MTMSTPPLVSIVIPCFNHEHLVAECLQSVAAQTYPDLEVILLDDASQDGTAAAIERVLAQESFQRRFGGRVRFERHTTNQGAHRTLNEGIGLARGSYVGIVNSDDRYTPERVALLVDALRTGSSALAFSLVRMIDSRGRDVTDVDWLASMLSHAQRRIDAFPSVGFSALRVNVGISTGNFFFERTLFDRVGGFRPLLYCHDWDFLLRALLLTEPVFVRQPLYEYRFHETNSFHSLGDVRDKETSAVLRAYFSAVQRGQFENPLAPGPTTWPGIFEVMLNVLKLGHHWEHARRSPVD
jgi:glycosyltransferase involved in cell wall biosynthesis